MSLAGSLCSLAASAHPLHLIPSRSLSSPCPACSQSPGCSACGFNGTGGGESPGLVLCPPPSSHLHSHCSSHSSPSPAPALMAACKEVFDGKMGVSGALILLSRDSRAWGCLLISLKPVPVRGTLVTCWFMSVTKKQELESRVFRGIMPAFCVYLHTEGAGKSDINRLWRRKNPPFVCTH